MGPDEIKVGGLYVGGKISYLIREVYDISADGDVRWRSYFIKTGEPTGDSFLCSKRTMAQWSEREATEEEKAKLNRDQAISMELDRAYQYVEYVLRNMPDQMLLDEVRRRGLKLGDE